MNSKLSEMAENSRLQVRDEGQGHRRKESPIAVSHQSHTPAVVTTQPLTGVRLAVERACLWVISVHKKPRYDG